MNGFGISPAGTSAAGAGTPLGRPFIPVEEGPSDLVAVRGIDPKTGDYVWREENGTVVFEPMSPTLQRVLIAVANVRGSIALDPLQGNGALALRKDDGHLELTVRNGVERALAGLLSEGAISLNEVLVEREGSTLFFSVDFTDTSTRQRQTTAQQAL